MGTPDSSISKPSAEVRLDVRSEGTTTDKASQDSLKPTLLEVNPRITNQLKTKEVHVDMHSEGTTIDKTSQDGRKSTEGMPKVAENSRELFHAALKGNWKSVQKNLRHAGQAMTTPVMTKADKPITVLEVAVQAGQDKLVENLFKRLPLEHKDDFKDVLINAARRGRIRMVKAVIDKVDVHPDTICTALSYAISFAPLEKEVIWYLASRTSYCPRFGTMISLISAGHMDIALYLARQFYGLASSTDNPHNTGTSLLGHLATMKSYFQSGARFNFWEHCIYYCIPLSLVKTSFHKFKDKNMSPAVQNITLEPRAKPVSFFKRISELKRRHHCSFEFANLALAKNEDCMKSLETLIPGIILNAASCGIYEIVQLCLQQFPELMWDENFTLELIAKVVKGRHVELFRLLNEADTHPVFDEGIWRKNKLMDAVTEWSPGCVSADVTGAAFLMQRELQWFKELEGRSHHYFESHGLSTEKTSTKAHWENFVEKHQDLHKEAAQWMKDTSSSCSVVATLIITVAFSAAFAVPGGNDGSTGIPIFIKKGSFMVFAIANAFALFSSVTSTLMFLAILTSRYAVEDFLHSLPRKMILGLTFLFLSLASMLVAFGSALTIILSERSKRIYIPIILLAAIPVVLFVILQLPLYYVMVKSTFFLRLDRPLKLWE